MYSATIGARHYKFRDLANLLAKASPLRSGDQLAGLSADTDEERIAARHVLADLPLATFLHQHVVPYEACEVTRLIVDKHDQKAVCAGSASDGWRVSRLALV
jgi:ethanolamine ammonia-lyase large subunit